MVDHKTEIMTRDSFEQICSLLPADVRGQLLNHARVPRWVALRALDITEDATLKKVVDANPDLVHKLPGETKARYRSTVIARLLAGNRCAAQGEGANEVRRRKGDV